MFKAINANSITLYLINEDNLDEVFELFKGYPDTEDIINEINENYLPKYQDGIRTNYGFYCKFNDQVAGLSLLEVYNPKELKGSTGADTLIHMRGKGIAPNSKPHLFYLAFEILGLNRVETGHFVSNHASQRSIEKTPGFIFEGIMRESAQNSNGIFEDELLYAILRKDWEKLYDKSIIKVIY